MYILKAKVNGQWVDIPAIKGVKGDDGLGVPSGGTTHQVLRKKSNVDNDTEWADSASGNVDDVLVNDSSVVVNKIAHITVPTKTSDITNDSGFLTSHQSLAAYRTSSAQDTIDSALSGRIGTIEGKESGWDAKADVSDIPTKTSDLTNDSGFITSHQSLSAYRTASEQDVIDLTKASASSVSDIEALIPQQATSSNQLADKAFVNSSISTNTANFKGTLDATTDLGLTKPASHSAIVNALNSHTFSPIPTNNDYCFVINSDEDSDVLYDRFKATDNSNTIVWGYEYTLNNSSFTSAQWNAINSGISSNKVSSYDSHIADTSNPHSVTKAQVGLGNVPNTDFSNNISALEAKTSLSDFTDDLGNNPTHTHSQYLTSHQSLANYSTTTEMNTSIEAYHDSSKYDASNPSGFITSSYHDSTKQDTINDLITIRSGASAGATAVQPSAISNMVIGSVAGMSIWKGTQTQYDAIATKSDSTIYFIV